MHMAVWSAHGQAIIAKLTVAECVWQCEVHMAKPLLFRKNKTKLVSKIQDQETQEFVFMKKSDRFSKKEILEKETTTRATLRRHAFT